MGIGQSWSLGQDTERVMGLAGQTLTAPALFRLSPALGFSAPTPSCRSGQQRVGLPPARFSHSPETARLTLQVESEPPCTQTNTLERLSQVPGSKRCGRGCGPLGYCSLLLQIQAQGVTSTYDWGHCQPISQWGQGTPLWSGLSPSGISAQALDTVMLSWPKRSFQDFL